MAAIVESVRIQLKNILFLTDFSDISDAALAFATTLARRYGARVHALHVLTPVIPEGCPEAVGADAALAESEMARLTGRLENVAHDTQVIRGLDLWPAVQRTIENDHIDLIVLGTHGRTHASKLLLGSFAEEIFRRSSVPVLTIGPGVRRNSADSGAFHSILFATNFSRPSEAAAPYAISLAEENDARLILLYVAASAGTTEQEESLIGDIVQRLKQMVPPGARMLCRPAAVVQYGEAADRILEVAAERDADLIVLGVKDAKNHLGAATHLERAVAHQVVAHARCPVLTVRG